MTHPKDDEYPPVFDFEPRWSRPLAEKPYTPPARRASRTPPAPRPAGPIRRLIDLVIKRWMAPA